MHNCQHKIIKNLNICLIAQNAVEMGAETTIFALKMTADIFDITIHSYPLMLWITVCMKLLNYVTKTKEWDVQLSAYFVFVL